MTIFRSADWSVACGNQRNNHELGMNPRTTSRISSILGVAALLAGVISFSGASQAQAPSARPSPPAAKSAPLPAPGGDAALARRVEQLEEQLVDMQVVIGTLESLARGATAPVGNRGSVGAAISAGDQGRLDGIETQIRALAAQIEQLQEQIRALPRRSGEVPPAPGGPNLAAADPPPGPRPGRPQPGAAAPPERTGFGSTTVVPDDPDDEINRLLGDQPKPGNVPKSGPAPRVASLPGPATPSGEAEASPKQLYEAAYGYLLQRDYGAAESAFEDFLKRFPSDPLGANAQYWLGESLYVRGQYRAAAAAFLKGYQNYGRSAKAPEALLKLAMSLQRLGQKDAACTSFNELNSKYPSAPAHVKSTAVAERQRAGCT